MTFLETSVCSPNGRVGLDAHPFPLGHDFKIGLGALAAKSGSLGTAERHVRLVVQRGRVDMDHPGLDFASEPKRLVDVAREDRGSPANSGVGGKDRKRRLSGKYVRI